MPRHTHRKRPKPLNPELLGPLASRIANMGDTFNIVPIEHDQAPAWTRRRGGPEDYRLRLGWGAALAAVFGAMVWVAIGYMIMRSRG